MRNRETLEALIAISPHKMSSRITVNDLWILGGVQKRYVNVISVLERKVYL